MLGLASGLPPTVEKAAGLGLWLGEFVIMTEYKLVLVGASGVGYCSFVTNQDHRNVV